MSTITLVPQPSGLQVKALKPGITLEQAKKEINNQLGGDGYDTIGFQVGDQAFLAYGKGLEAKVGQNVDFNGQKGEVKFFENESNSVSEGFSDLKDNWKGLLGFVGFGSTISGLNRAAEISSSLRLLKSLGADINVKAANQHMVKQGLKGAAIGGAVIGTVFIGGTVLASVAKPTNDRVLRSLTMP